MRKKNLIQKSNNEIGKFRNRKKSTYRRTGPLLMWRQRKKTKQKPRKSRLLSSTKGEKIG